MNCGIHETLLAFFAFNKLCTPGPDYALGPRYATRKKPPASKPGGGPGKPSYRGLVPWIQNLPLS
jgi:hypothetical protein